MRWIVFTTLFVVINGCGGPKKKSGTVSNATPSVDGAGSASTPADQTLIEILLFNPADVSSEDASLAGKLNTYEFSLTKTDPDCVGAEKEPVTGILSATTTRRVIQITNSCAYEAQLNYGFAPQAAPADQPPAPAEGNEEKPAPEPASLAPTYQNFVKDIIDFNCVSCHGAASAPRSDLSTYASVLKSFRDDTGNLNSLHRIEKKDAEGATYIVMPPSGTIKASSGMPHETIVSNLIKWKDAGFPEGEAAGLNLTLELGSDSVYYRGVPLLLSKDLLTKKRALSLRFLLTLTDEGKEQGFTALLLQGETYVRSGNKTPSDPGVDSGEKEEDTGEGVEEEKEEGEKPADNGTPPAPEQLDLTQTFDQVGPFLLDADKGNCAAAGCHAAGGVAPLLATYTDFKTYIEADPLNKSTLAGAIKNKTMPVSPQGTLDDPQRLQIRGWIEGGHKPGPVTQAAIDAANPAPLTFNNDVFPLVMASCGTANAGCHSVARTQIGAFTNAAAAFNEFSNDAKRAIIIGRMNNAANPMPQAGLIPTRNDPNNGIITIINKWATDGKVQQ